MRPQISLKLFVTLIFLSLMLVLVIGYSFLSIHFFRKGVDSITAMNMEEAARMYVASTSAEKRDQPGVMYGYHIARTWEQLPSEVRSSFESPPTHQQVFKISRLSSDPTKRPDILNFAFRYQENNEILYVGKRSYRLPGPTLLGKFTHESRRILVVVSVLVAAVLALAIFLLFRLISRPIIALERWTRELGPDNLEQSPPDFSYPELNTMAELVRSSLSSVQESLNREHRFLRYASHELRTPIAVIRNNIELVTKLDQLPEPRRSEEQKLLFGRIERAGLNMQYLTESLLWLYRGDIDTLPGRNLALDELITQLADEMRYLLNGKDVELQVDTHETIVNVPEIPAQIILRNLVRNAFQHTQEGPVQILQRDNVVTITNPRPVVPKSELDSDQPSLGFGFGLQLITQLTHKLGWSYSAQSEKSAYIASITLHHVSRVL